MKKYKKNILIISALIILNSCVDEPVPFASDSAPGFNVTYVGEEDFLSFTKNSDETIDGEINILGKWFAKPDALLDRVVLIKSLLNSNNDEIDSAIENRDLVFNDSVSFSVTNVDELFSGFSTSINDLKVGSRFRFQAIGITPSADTLFINNATFFDAEYISFCEKPQLTLGTWTATNTITNFSKDVELIWDDVYGVYLFTDFGIDWSNWDDFWYGTMFNLACPLIEGNPVQVELAGFGWDTNDEYEMLGDNGTLETRRLRRMPYIYKEGSPKGYYDSTTEELVFNNISVTDAWWDADQHDFSMSFKKKQ
ncbi:hypothetical protein [uncultured Polaribacter sp.]|uniref:hypothetical protein n=1 Tax=uncultured Polaribacter sp. TaxID=174711 RepID=UPI00260DF0A2|nr:hypothetical protein [uncultured Polaribacter sp.]